MKNLIDKKIRFLQFDYTCTILLPAKAIPFTKEPIRLGWF